MRKLHNGLRREIFAQLYLDLSTGLSEPWRQRGIAIRQSFDMVAMAGLIILNHRQNKVTTADDIQQVLGIPRSTAQRRCAFMARHGYLTIKGQECQVSDQFAAAPLLSPANFVEIENAIHRASDLLHKLNDENTDEPAA
jgi:hypothetical protein